MNIEVIENTKTGVLDIFIDKVCFGTFDDIDVDGQLCYFPKRNDQLTGDHLILIGQKLNELNGQ